VPGQGETRDNRVAGLGSLSGIVTGVGIGAVFGMPRTGSATWRRTSPTAP